MKSTYYHFIEFPDISPRRENADGKSFTPKKSQSNNYPEMLMDVIPRSCSPSTYMANRTDGLHVIISKYRTYQAY